jgi:hypothetical protein
LAFPLFLSLHIGIFPLFFCVCLFPHMFSSQFFPLFCCNFGEWLGRFNYPSLSLRCERGSLNKILLCYILCTSTWYLIFGR